MALRLHLFHFLPCHPLLGMSRTLTPPAPPPSIDPPPPPALGLVTNEFPTLDWREDVEEKRFWAPSGWERQRRGVRWRMRKRWTA